MRIHAFCGQRFSNANGNPGDWAAPPFDQISTETGARLRQDPHNFTHLTRPDPDAEDPHELSATTLNSWLESGHVVTEAEPALYLYETTLPTGGVRLGLCALAEVGHGDIRPHEQTVDKTVEERLQLLRRIRTDLEPVFLLVDDGGRLNRLLGDEVDNRQVTALDTDGNRHSIQPITSNIDEYKQSLVGVDGLIADGHHRTRVATLYAEETSAGTVIAAGCKLVVIVSLASEGLTIDPIHRGFADETDIEPLRDLTTEYQVVDGTPLEEAVAEAEQPAIGVWKRGAPPEVWRLDPDAVRAAADGPVPDLPVALFHAAFPALGWDPASATNGTITYRSDPARLADEMQTGAFPLSIWLPPMTAKGFSEALEVLPVLPPKSTRFLPKLVSGMVWSPHDQQIL